MMRTVKGILFLAGATLLFILPQTVAAEIRGNCTDCHTDTNSPQESPVGALYRDDCVSCHALGTEDRIVTLPGGIRVPQVFHYDTERDLAGGNFSYVADEMDVGPTGSRKGHDVIDLFPGDFTFPPGFIHNDPKYTYFRKITCAGVNGCHGIRNQMMIGPQGERIPRVGVAALQGAHHANVDGKLIVADRVANSYRFILGLHGLEHTYAPDRWQNVTPVIHNEYFGSTYRPDYDLCATCHLGSPQRNLESSITTPAHTMSGFCSTCHSQFHMEVGVASAFIRHPSDFVIPNRGEYAQYRFYEITAPVARPILEEEPTDLVTPGRDMVMCLSCHVAHGSPYDGMLRFDYSEMTAGDAGSAAGIGCFACHTSKGGP